MGAKKNISLILEQKEVKSEDNENSKNDHNLPIIEEEEKKCRHSDRDESSEDDFWYDGTPSYEIKLKKQKEEQKRKEKMR